VSGAFIYLQGGKPITDFLQGQLELSDTGCLVVDREFQTAIASVFAVGDVLCNHVKQAVIAAAEGATAGIAVEKVLRGRKQLVADWSK
jgi:thioredoxin reductase (NADPH)